MLSNSSTSSLKVKDLVLRNFSSSQRERLGKSLGTGIRRYNAGKQITFGANARAEIMKGCNSLADAVSVTLGPKGRNVIIESAFGGPKITKDGVTVAKSIDLPNPLQNMGAQLIKQVAQSTSDTAGDGTTTSTILARAIYRECCEAVAAGMNPMDLLRGIDKALHQTRKFLEEHAKPVSSSEELLQVATVSANGDSSIGRLIAQAMEKVGRDGVITVGTGRTLVHELLFVEGYQIDRGFVSPYFMTNAKTQKCELETPYILLYDKKLQNVNVILPILEEIAKTNSSLLIVAEDFDSDVLSTLILNKLRLGLQVCTIRAPGFGDFRKEMLEDLAAMTGAKVCGTGAELSSSSISISRNTGGRQSIKEHDVAIDFKSLGTAKRVEIGKDETLILEGATDLKKKAERIDNLKYAIDNSDVTDYEKDKLKERLAKLTGGVAVIKVGGASEFEVGETKDRVDDALCATRAAVESGVLPGGGVSLLGAAESLNEIKGDNPDQDVGIKILQRACRIPCKTIAANAGHEGSVVAGDILRKKVFGYGFDAQKNEYVDMLATGILDPAKVVITAITDAAKIASLMATTEVAINSVPTTKSENSTPSSTQFD